MWIDRRLLLAAGALSLLLNVFLIGLVAGHVLARTPGGGSQGPGGPLVRRANVKQLSPDERGRFAAAMRAHRPAIRAARDEVRARRQAVDATLAAPAFDRADASAALAGLRAANNGVAEAVHAALVDALAVLSPSARTTLLARERPGRDGKAPGDRSDDHPAEDREGN